MGQNTPTHCILDQHRTDMLRSKTQSTSDESTEDGQERRKRAVKACQRCRLKKCKCDGSAPCTRCRNDDAICTYGKHKRSEKTMFRQGYVQMLERQHTQLIAGLQELYRRTQPGEGWVGPRPDSVNYGQPLTHKILEVLGVLQQNEWDDGEGFNGTAWHSYQQHANDLASAYSSSATTPSTEAAFSPLSATQGSVPKSATMVKRRPKDQGSPTNAIKQETQMPYPPTNSLPSFGEMDFPHTMADSSFSMAASMAATMAPLDLNDDNLDFDTYSQMLNTNMGWAFGAGDEFIPLHPAGQGIPLQFGVS